MSPNSFGGIPIGVKNSYRLKPGDCLVYQEFGVNTAEQSSIPIYDCNTPHDAEVFAETTLSGVAYPGDQAVKKQTSDFCDSQWLTYVGNARVNSKLSLFTYYPVKASWEQGDRLATCIIYDKAPYTGLLEGTKR